MLQITRRILFILRQYKYHIGIIICVFFLFSYMSKDECKTDVKIEKVVERVVIDDKRLSNSIFSVNKKSLSYDVNYNPSCWNNNCNGITNLNAYKECEDNKESNEWNALGMRSMEKYLVENSTWPQEYSQKYLVDAYNYFSNASNLSPNCFTPTINLGIVAIKLKDWERAKSSLLRASQLADTPYDKALSFLFLGILHERLNDVSLYQYYYDKSMDTYPPINKEWFGIIVSDKINRSRSDIGTGSVISEPILDLSMYQYFSPKHISRYALLKPGTQDLFIENQFIVLRKIVPPFVLSALRNCYDNLINHGLLTLGDSQSTRYIVHNDRCGRFIHHKLTDLVRIIIAHDAIPSYTYFGGYIGGSILKPHTDRHQCEFTISLTIDQSHQDQIWPLSLSKDPLFIKNDTFEGGHHDLPPRNVVESAILSRGDGLLFMGRHLIHFREGKLTKGHWLRQAFLHYVRDDFDKELD